MINKALNTFMIVSALLVFQSCEKDEFAELISKYNGTNSHNMGQNCMSCHKQGGTGESIFRVAGTVYDSLKIATFPNATIKLSSGTGGTGNLKVIEADAFGNFFTTENIDFGNGIFVSVSGTSSTRYMLSPVSSGQCNSCHGVSTARIWTE